MTEHTICIGDLLLEDGTVLPAVEQRVTIYGTPAKDGGNVVLVPHALTGSSRVAEWWPGIVGAGTFFDPKEWCIVGINALGGCYGSTGPSASSSFPQVTVGDIVRAQRRALEHLGIQRIRLVIGGSLGGMQVFQWALDAPWAVEQAIVIGAHDHHSPMGIALNSIQRECLELDPVRGLGTARKLAMLSYKSERLFNLRHGRNRDRSDPSKFDIEGYLDHQATKFLNRMDAKTYAALTHAMDSFDVRDRFRETHAALTFIGITSDWLFRPEDIAAAARRFNAQYIEMASDHGHDAFLAEPEELARLIEPLILASNAPTRPLR